MIWAWIFMIPFVVAIITIEVCQHGDFQKVDKYRDLEEDATVGYVTHRKSGHKTSNATIATIVHFTDGFEYEAHDSQSELYGLGVRLSVTDEHVQAIIKRAESAHKAAYLKQKKKRDNEASGKTAKLKKIKMILYVGLSVTVLAICIVLLVQQSLV